MTKILFIVSTFFSVAFAQAHQSQPPSRIYLGVAPNALGEVVWTRSPSVKAFSCSAIINYRSNDGKPMDPQRISTLVYGIDAQQAEIDFLNTRTAITRAPIINSDGKYLLIGVHEKQREPAQVTRLQSLGCRELE